MVVKVVDVVDIKVVVGLIVVECVGVLLLLASRNEMILSINSLVV